MALNLTYSRNRWNGSFRVSCPEINVNFTIGNGISSTLKVPLSINIALKYEFEGTAPNGTKYTSYKLLFSLVYKGNSVLEIQWADGTKDTITVSQLNCGVLLDISANANGLLAILDDGAIGLGNMVWKDYANVAVKFAI